MNSVSIATEQPPNAHQIRIAMPIQNGAFCTHFGGASHFRIVDAERATGKILEQQDLEAPEHVPGAFPEWLAKQGVHAVIVAAIGQRAVQLFTVQGIPVYIAEPGATPEKLVELQAQGKLVQPNAAECCPGHGHDHGDQSSEHHCH
ncbi:MAG: NifB/NifX family molybdenum-iron cluster-binding protein [Chthoniobacteraceae bacterium]